MKIFIYVYYFFRSVFLRGLSATVRLVKAELNYEKKFGIQSSGIKKSNSREFFHYQGAGYLVLLRIFREIYEETKHFDFVDIGCGKGRAVFVAENCGYNNLTGIELDEELIGEANANLRSYSFKRKESVIRFIHMNALKYSYQNRPTVYFLFNPFNEDILRRVLERICLSTRSETWFIYMNPMYAKPFKEKTMEIVKEFKTGRYTEAIVYRIHKENK